MDIESATVEDLLRLVRFEPIGSPVLQGEQGEAIMKKLDELRKEDPAAYVAASKRIGWS